MENHNTENRDRHLFSESKKRILSLDGGGVRGIWTLQVLKKLEHLLSQQHKKEIRLCDYFDLIGGTSTGAIIAAALALGWRVEKINRLYMELAQSVFQSDIFRKGLFRAKFDSAELERQLFEHFGDITLGSGQLHTGLAIMLKRLDTGSPWIISNNPRGKYYGPRAGRTTKPNRDYLLRKVVRASAAAPTYFEPERLQVAEDVTGAFVDGGVSPHNNPALQLFMLATLHGYGLKWPLGEENILLVSVGTGESTSNKSADELLESSAAALGVRSLFSVMDDASALNETLLQWISTSPTRRSIDREIGTLGTDNLGGHPQLTYLRYNAFLDQHWLRTTLGVSLSKEQVDHLERLDQPENMHQLTDIGNRFAAAFVKADHFPIGFKIPGYRSASSIAAVDLQE